ncbi:hypothetical protein LOTGIDRAFT_158460 [Lottia gigantea]|uniref:Uncharacterized protein n=1 Tax=Lottia gigantea TaxID=225164 RepID=V4A658_LOTGI|nr:hypothetical protein LOTGIDRAFT_158460 [Lottia gigantea]ESO99373.1 hypothetical protein LOTGIDRAFT_158460 [Lottia gigantea]
MIVAHAPKTYFGSGDIQKSLGSLPGFPWAKYPGEKIFPVIITPVQKLKKPNTTAWINKAKPFFVDQIGDTLQGDLDMNNFSITNLKSPENDNDAIHKKYLRDQINSIEVNKNHLEDKISNVKRFFKRQLNNKNFVNDTKLQQEVQRLISFIQKELVNVANKTEVQNLISLISELEDKIAKQKLDIQQLIDNIPDENEDTFQQELNALETKLNSELQKELTNIKKQIQNIDDSEIKTYIQQQIQNKDDSEIKTYIHQQIQNIDDSVIQQQITTINNLVLKQDKNIVALEKKFLKKESYYFNFPFGNLRQGVINDIDRSKDYEYKKYGFKVNIRVFSTSNFFNPHYIFNSDYPSDFTFKGKLVIEINFPIQVKVDSIFFRQNHKIHYKFNAQKVLKFINGRDNVEIKEYESNDENNKVNHLYEIKTSGKYIDRCRMLIIPDNKEDELSLSDFDMILQSKTSPSMNIRLRSI